MLTRKKAQYAPIGDTVNLRWQNGVLVPLGGQSAAARAFRRPCEDVFMAILDAVIREKQDVGVKSGGGSYAPTLFARRPAKDREGYERKRFRARHAGAVQMRKSGDGALWETIGTYGETDPKSALRLTIWGGRRLAAVVWKSLKSLRAAVGGGVGGGGGGSMEVIEIVMAAVGGSRAAVVLILSIGRALERARPIV